jgi:hypothetical protein
MRLYNFIEKTEDAVSIVQATNGTTYDVSRCQTLGFLVQATVGAFSARVVPSAAIDASANTFTFASHGFVTGLIVRTTTSSALPAPLLVATDYFVIKVDANTFKLASTVANAVAGTPIDLTTVGIGDQTVTPTALAGASVKLQRSMDNSVWTDDGSATNITVTANVVFEKVDPTFRFYRVQYALTSGAVTAQVNVLAKGYGE